MHHPGSSFVILKQVDSTNNYAMAKVRTGLANHGDAYFAMAQLKGKGQRGKTWVTQRGTNIIITLVMQPHNLLLPEQFKLSAAVALAAHDFFAHYAGEETFIKWPNDIYWRDRKAGGILIESIIGSHESTEVNGQSSVISKEQVNSSVNSTEERTAPPSPLLANSWKWAIIGMGININQTSFPGHINNAVSLKQITGKDWDVIALAKELCGHVQNRYRQLQDGIDLLPSYNNHLYKKGQTAKLKKGSRVFEGLIKEVNALGELIVMTTIEERFNFGEIQWVMGND